jgi:hypothetical protein
MSVLTTVRLSVPHFLNPAADNVLGPAQLQASEAGLSKVLVDIVSGERLSASQSSLSHIMTILELLSNQGMSRLGIPLKTLYN